jgi:hypothetical protein
MRLLRSTTAEYPSGGNRIPTFERVAVPIQSKVKLIVLGVPNWREMVVSGRTLGHLRFRRGKTASHPVSIWTLTL